MDGVTIEKGNLVRDGLDIEIYDQVQSVGPAFRTNTKSMSPFLIKKIERYKEICSVLSEAYNQKTAKKAAAKEEQPKEM